MCTAVGTGFVIMGAVGYIVKLSTSSLLLRNVCVPTNLAIVHVPINHTLVGGA